VVKKYLLIIMIVFVLLLPGWARAADFEQLRSDAAKIKTLQALFVQKKQLKILSKPLISEGRFFYVAPDAIRWEYLKPLKSVVVFNKGEARRYLMSGGKMVEDKSGSVQAMSIVLGEISNWLGGKFNRNPSFQASLKKGVNVMITLVPVDKNMAGMMEKIEITIAKNTMAIKSVKIIESENAATIIDFRQVEINKAISGSLFQEIK